VNQVISFAGLIKLVGVTLKNLNLLAPIKRSSRKKDWDHTQYKLRDVKQWYSHAGLLVTPSVMMRWW
jgi:hypothetical protein